MSIQAPPNLSSENLEVLIQAGINDWGGVSPVTPDYVNPEAPWPNIAALAKQTENAGKFLHQRLTIYPSFAVDGATWLHKDLRTPVMRMIDSEGFPRIDGWYPGHQLDPPLLRPKSEHRPILKHTVDPSLIAIVDNAAAGKTLDESDIVRMFQARGPELEYVCDQANMLRETVSGNAVTYAVNRNINYTNVCYFKCHFCAFSKGKRSAELRGPAYSLSHSEISRRTEEAWKRGASEVCMQGGIHPHFSGRTYVDILDVVKAASPDIHVHAFSPLEIWQGAQTMGVSLRSYLLLLKEHGLGTLPGTAAEILDDEVRDVICSDKINSEQWLEVIETAHQVGIRTTSTILFGHVETIQHWARHLLKIRDLQEKTGGFTEFVPLPFVHTEAPMFLKGNSRMGPTFRECVLMHAVARIVFHLQIDNIQVSWVKMGEAGVRAILDSGANDLGGTLMNESITRAAGGEHGQEFPPEKMDELIMAAGRVPRQRNTLYGRASPDRQSLSYGTNALLPIINDPFRKSSDSNTRKRMIS